MTPFLQLVAQDLCRKYGADMSRIAVVFPNKRAELFMNEYLLQSASQAPLWAPRYITINQLFRQFTSLAVNDPIDTVCRISQLYADLSQTPVELDLFYGWAERILSDFDDIDKNMADVGSLLRNLQDLKDLEDMDFLSDEQKQLLQRFFTAFDPEQRSELREKFRQLWEHLLPLYRRLNAELLAEGLAYEGALYRSVIEQLERGALTLGGDAEVYVFVGFNVLDQVEQRLFKWLQREGKALFYWDYDEFYVPRQGETHFEAGLFLHENLLRFGNELDAKEFDNLRHIERVEMVAASTEVVQAQSVGQWLESHLTPDPKRTAVVICNENMLQPLLHALPDNVEEVNITKGFPLSHTQAATTVERRFAEFDRKAQALTTTEMLDNLIALINEQAQDLLEAEDFSEQRFECVLQTEGYCLMAGLLNRLRTIANHGRLSLTAVVLRRVVRQIMRQTTIPFQGEPAVGLQVMGVLETRCLDFENVVMLSVNEGVLPQKANDNSFIPYALRKAFGLTTPERQTAVYAYYFYRLIQRSRHLRLLYNSSSEGMVQGEMSRFMTQLLVESDLSIRHYVITCQQEMTSRSPQAVAKPDNLVELLAPPTAEGLPSIPKLSPSAINTYLRCPLSFYYQYVAKYKEPLPDPDEIQPNVLGTIFHKAAELIYQDLAKTSPEGYIAANDLKALEKDEQRLSAYVAAAFEDSQTEFRVLEANVIAIYLGILLRHDSRLMGLRLVDTERCISYRLPLPKGAAVEAVDLAGIIDRVDRILYDGKPLLRIVDYKTGGKQETAKDLDQLLRTFGINQKHYMLQTFVYALMMTEQSDMPDVPLAPALFFLHHAYKEGYSPYLKMDKQLILDFKQDFPTFKRELAELIAEIFDPSQAFGPIANDSKTCESCKYRALCYL